jgi:hypothetical protein
MLRGTLFAVSRNFRNFLQFPHFFFCNFLQFFLGGLPQFQTMGIFDTAIFKRGSKSQYMVYNPQFVLGTSILSKIVKIDHKYVISFFLLGFGFVL